VDSVKRRRVSRLVLVFLFVALVAEGVFFVAYGRFNIDEGLHLNAGRLVFEQGRLPYGDFPFSQGPGGPLLYGAAGAVFGSSLLVGRSLSLLVNLIGLGAMIWFAGRISGAVARWLVVLLTMVNLPAIWTFAQIRTESPSIPLVVLAAIALFFRKGSALRWALAPCLLVWATSVRLTCAIPLVAVCLLVGFELRRSPRTLLVTSAIVTANALLAALPMLMFSRQAFFHIFIAQIGRAERFGWDRLPAAAKFWFLGEPATSFLPILLLTCFPVFVLFRCWRRGWRPRGLSCDDPASVLACLIAMALLSYVPHLLFRIGFFHYFVNASVLLTLAIVIAIPMVARESRRGRIWVSSSVAAVWVVAAVLGLQHIETWVTLDRPTISRFAEVRSRLQLLAPHGCTMMTFETYLAVETQCEVLSGLEYSYFSFFPELTFSEAEEHGVLNRRRLMGRIEQDGPEFIALTWRAVEDITGRRGKREGPPMLDVMRGRYRRLTKLRVPVGPVHTFWANVHLYARSDLTEDPGEPRDYSM